VDQLLAQLHLEEKGKKVLDLAAGTGKLTRYKLALCQRNPTDFA